MDMVKPIYSVKLLGTWEHWEHLFIKLVITPS